MINPKTFATAYHSNQMYDDVSYMRHLEEVDTITQNLPGGYRNKDVRAVAYLHDVLEDTRATFAMLVNVYGLPIAQAVSMVTDPEGLNRYERKQIVNRRLCGADIQSFTGYCALLVKAADRLANMRNSTNDRRSWLRMYITEYPDFRRAVRRHGYFVGIWSEMDEIYFTNINKTHRS